MELPAVCTCRAKSTSLAWGAKTSARARPLKVFQLAEKSCSAEGLAEQKHKLRSSENTALGTLPKIVSADGMGRLSRGRTTLAGSTATLPVICLSIVQATPTAHYSGRP